MTTSPQRPRLILRTALALTLVLILALAIRAALSPGHCAALTAVRVCLDLQP